MSHYWSCWVAQCWFLQVLAQSEDNARIRKKWRNRHQSDEHVRHQNINVQNIQAHCLCSVLTWRIGDPLCRIVWLKAILKGCVLQGQTEIIRYVSTLQLYINIAKGTADPGVDFFDRFCVSWMHILHILKILKILHILHIFHILQFLHILYILHRPGIPL